MSLVNNSANNFKDFLDAIKPYLNYQFYDMSGQGVEANNFSTDEKVIGTWVDGKPLYQKTFEWTYANGSLIPDAGSLVISNTADIKCICDGCLKYTDNGGNTDYTPIATTFPDSETARNQWTASFSNINVANQRIGFRLGSGWKQNTYTNIRISVTMKYTKTTDTAVASGEKIVGQWIDGKPIWQKTYKVEVPNTGSDTQVQSIAGLNADKIVDYKQMVMHANPSDFRNESRIDIKESATGLNNQIQRVSVWISSDYIYVRNSASYFVGDDLYITLQYTKTS